MFGLGSTYDDPELGALKRSWWNLFSWVVQMDLSPHGPVDLRVCGSWFKPDAVALSLARQLHKRYSDLQPSIAAKLFDNYECCEDRVEGVEGFPGISTPGGVWAHVRVDEVTVESIGTLLTIEIAYEPDWDPEHRKGAWIREWRLVHLNSSV